VYVIYSIVFKIKGKNEIDTKEDVYIEGNVFVMTRYDAIIVS
jgi:hypothetical protein